MWDFISTLSFPRFYCFYSYEKLGSSDGSLFTSNTFSALIGESDLVQTMFDILFI